MHVTGGFTAHSQDFKFRPGSRGQTARCISLLKILFTNFCLYDCL